MERYKPNANCPKCGWDNVTTSLHKSGYSWKGCSCTNAPNGGREHLSRHCTRCHYEWAEETIDFDANAKEN